MRCVYEEPPEVYGCFPSSINALGHPGHRSERRHRGFVWHHWSSLWADRHSEADFIAFIDTDAVLTSFAQPRLLFDPTPGPVGQPRPVIFGRSNDLTFMRTVTMLGLHWDAEFMDAFPMVIRRDHFAAMREFIVERMERRGTKFTRGTGIEEPTPMQVDALSECRRANESGSSSAWEQRVDAAFVDLVRRVAGPSSEPQEAFCIQSAMGSFLWQHHRKDYAWSIRHGFLQRIPLQHTCPRLRGAQHLSKWGRSANEGAFWRLAGDYEWKPLRFHDLGHPLHAPLASNAYALRAEQLVTSGLCAAAWRRKAGAAEAPGLALDEGWREIRRELCGDLPPPAPANGPASSPWLGANLTEARLLATFFPAGDWTEVEAGHCGEFRPSRLVADYRRLLASLEYLVDG